MSQSPVARQTASSLPFNTEPDTASLLSLQVPRLANPNAELEFMQAMQDYKQSSGRMFPTWSEVLEVLKALGYTKIS
jgi:hypothetical protein